jgi:hypothetical protein
MRMSKVVRAAAILGMLFGIAAANAAINPECLGSGCGRPKDGNFMGVNPECFPGSSCVSAIRLRAL